MKQCGSGIFSLVGNLEDLTPEQIEGYIGRHASLSPSKYHSNGICSQTFRYGIVTRRGYDDNTFLRRRVKNVIFPYDYFDIDEPLVVDGIVHKFPEKPDTKYLLYIEDEQKS